MTTNPPLSHDRTKTIVFCEPPYVFWDRSLDGLRKGEETIPGMGVLILAAVARQKGYRVHLIDAKEQGRALDEVAAEIAALRPDYLGLSATTISITNAARIAARVKQLVPSVVTIVGGAHVSAIPERTLDAFPELDYGIVGEGEHSLFDLLDRLDSAAALDSVAARESVAALDSAAALDSVAARESVAANANGAANASGAANATGAAIETVQGLAYRRDGKVIANPRAPYIDDLDELPAPAWDLLPDFPHRFQPTLFSYTKSPVASLITSRGCPFSCSFCDRSTSGRKGRMHSVEYIVEQCRHLGSLGVKHILFVDDLFTVKRERVVALCKAFLDNGFGFTWSCTSHPNLLDLETMQLMKRAGCWQIAYGIESGSPRVLNVVKHEVKIPRMRETLRLTRQAGIRAKGYVMLGHPTEGLDSLSETLEFLKTVELDMCQITKFTPYPGTPAYPTIAKHGSFVENWEEMNAMNFVFLPNGLTRETLETYFDQCYRTFYSRHDVLLGLAKMMLREPRFLLRLASNSVLFLRNKSGAARNFFRRDVPAELRPQG